MSNTLLTITDITREALAVLHENLVLAKHAVRKYESRFGKSSGQTGTLVEIRKPPRFSVNTTADITGVNGDVTEDYVTLNVTTRRNVPMTFSSQDLTLSINDFSKQFILPVVKRLAREVDIVGFKMLTTSANSRLPHDVTTSLAFVDYVTLNARLTQQLAPMDERVLFADPMTHVAIINANKGLFQASTEIEAQYLKGYMGTSGGFDWVQTMNYQSITFPTTPALSLGTLSATPIEAASIIAITGGTANATFKAGQGFTVAGCYAIDPETQSQLNYLYTFINTADVVLSAAGAGNITVATPMYTVSGTNATKANVSALPQSSAAATRTETGTIVGGTTAPIAYGIQKDALALAVIELEVPGGVDMGASEEFDGISLRIIRVFNVLTDVWTTRVDIQFGWCVLRSELISSVVGQAA